VLQTASGAVAFYDMDTPVTIDKLRARDAEYLTPELVERFDLYLSFTAGPALEVLSEEFGARRSEGFYCFVDAEAYAPVNESDCWALNYLGTFSAGRQPTLDDLLVKPARARPDQRFAVAGPMYPQEIAWPANVTRIEHLAPREHARFYSATRFTLNVTRPEMRALGYSPSVRLFEAGACAAAIVSDSWPGLDTVFVPGEEILLADSCDEVLRLLDQVSDAERAAIGAAARVTLREILGRLVGEGMPIDVRTLGDAGAVAELDGDPGLRRHGLPDPDRLGLALGEHRLGRAVLDHVARGTVGRLADEDAVDGRRGLEPRRGVDDVA
jgi:spore maturation protein CgeB